MHDLPVSWAVKRHIRGSRPSIHFWIDVQTNQLLHDVNELKNLAPRREKEFVCSGRFHLHEFGGADRDRTGDLKLAKLALSQLSYGPNSWDTAASRLRGQDQISSPGQVLV